MANSALQRNPYFNGQAAPLPQQTYAAPGQQFGQQSGLQRGQQQYNPYGQFGQQGQQAPGQQAPQAPQFGTPNPDALNHQFDLPAATPDQMDRMSYSDTLTKTAGLFVVVLAAAAVAWFIPMLAIVGMIGSLVLGIVLAFQRTPKPVLIWLFAVAEGLLVGGISSIFENMWPGIVVQAMLATFAVVGTVLVLFRFGKVRTSPRLTKIVMVAMIAYAVFALINFGYTMLSPDASMFGMRSIEVFGIPLGVIVGILAVLMGAYMLVMDFELIENGVKSGAPRAFGWIAAYSIVATVVFIYIEILRVIALLRGSE